MIFLVYVSSASGPVSDAELLEILRTSRRNNERLGVTGMLLYKGTCFIQALEGPEAAVMGLFERIRRDPRHRQVTTLIKRPATERQFEGGSMGVKHLDRLAPEEAGAAADYLNAPITPERLAAEPNLIHRLLLGFTASMVGVL